MTDERERAARPRWDEKMSLGKIIFCVGMAGIVISLVLLIIGTYEIDNLVLRWLCIIVFIGIPISFILAVAGAISWYLEPFVDRIRARNRKSGDSKSDYNKTIDKS